MQFWQTNLNTLLSLFTNPLGLVGLVGLCIIAFLAVNSRFAFLILAAGFYLSVTVSPASTRTASGGLAVPIIEPFQSIRQNARVFTTAMTVGLLPSLLAHAAALARRSPATVLFVLTQITFQISLVVRGEFDIKPLLLSVTAVGLWFVITSVRSDQKQGWLRAWLPPIYAAVAFILINLLLAFISNGIKSGGRFQGFTSNPQGTGYVLSLSIILLVAALADKELRKVVALPGWVLLSIICIGVGLLAWTGSRGSALTCIIGLVALFGTKLGRASLILIPSAIGAYLVITYLFAGGDSQIFEATNRMLDTSNSRLKPWTQLWADFQKNPFIGAGNRGEAGFSESSYLLFAAQNGLLGLFPLLLTMGAILAECLKALRVYRDTGRQSLALRLPIAVFALVAVGAAAEAFLVSTFHYLVFLLLLSAQLGRSSLSFLAAEEQTSDFDAQPSMNAREWQYV